MVAKLFRQLQQKHSIESRFIAVHRNGFVRGDEKWQQATFQLVPLKVRLRPLRRPVNYSRPLAVVTTLFFMWGFLTCLNDILVPHLKAIFDLSYAKVMLIQFAFFSAYFLFSIPWSRVVNAIGYQKTMVVGLLTMAAGAFLFLPAASAASFPLFLTALMILAAGITGLQVAANPYVVVLGQPETASSRLDLTQAFNSLGTTIAPKLGGLLILAAAPLAIEELRQLAPQALHAYRVQEAATVKLPYTVIGIVLILLAVLIGSFKLPKIEMAAYQRGSNMNDSIWKHPNLILGAIGIFAYVGAEVSIGSFLVNYFGQADIANSFRQDGGRLRVVLLGRRYGRTFLGSRTASAIQTRLASWIVRHRCGVTGHDLYGRHGACGDVDHPSRWTVQFDHVSHNLQPWRRRARSFDRQCIGPAEHGDRWWGYLARLAGRDCRPRRDPPRVLAAGDLLSIHPVLRVLRIKAEQPTIRNHLANSGQEQSDADCGRYWRYKDRSGNFLSRNWSSHATCTGDRA